MSDQMINSALVNTWGETPKYGQIALPPPSPDDVQIKVLAAGLHQLVRTRASGTHYTSATLPHTPGVDGVGQRISDNKPVYFFTFPQGGSFQDVVNVSSRKVVEIPEGVDPIQVAGFANPVLSSWMALKTRVTGLKQGFCVLIIGATGASGSVGVEVARALGAGKVIGMARNAEALSALDVDDTILLDAENVEATDCGPATDVDVILDYLYGPVAQHVLASTKFSRPVQYVQIGSVAGPDMRLPASVLRSRDLTIRGAGIGSWSNAELARQVPGLLEVFRVIKPQKVKVVGLSEVERCWDEKDERIVFTP